MLGRVAATSRLRPQRLSPSIRCATASLSQSTRCLQDRSSKRFRHRGVPPSPPPDYKLPSTAKIPEWKRQASSQPPRIPPEQAASRPEQDSVEQQYQRTSHDAVQGKPAHREGVAQEGFEDLENTQRGAVAPEPTIEPVQQSTESNSEGQTPLPDLRQGIPSTFAAEFEQSRTAEKASPDSLNITEDPAQSSAAGGGRGGDGLPRSEYISSSDRRRSAAFRYIYAALLAGMVGYSAYLGRNWENEEEERMHADAPSGWGLGLFYNRVKARLGSTVAYYSDPVTTKLLPDEDKDPNLRYPFTLVISLEDMLIHEEWSRDKGWRIAKRPGLDYFLRYLSQYYEIVLFTSKPYAAAEQVVRKMDPFHMIQFPLFREHSLYQDGGYIKDLSYLNRPLKKIIMFDTDAHHAKNQPENAVILPKWDGNPNDQTLVQFIPFLEYLAAMGLEDARTVLKSFQGTYIPVEFARREKLLRQKFEEKEATSRPKKKSNLSLGSMFGTRTPDPQGLEPAQGKMLWDQIRERGQKHYQELEKRIREEGDKWLADQAAEIKKLEEEAMKEMKTSWMGKTKSLFSFGGEESK